MITPIFPFHKEHAKLMEFAGYEMPLFYTSAIQEAKAVRTRAGLFDVSHMGPIEVLGRDAEQFLDFLATNHIAGKPDGSATYTVLASETGGCIDDVMVMRLSKNRFIVVANAANKEKVLAHFTKEAHAFEHVTIVPLYKKAGLIALQGKEAANAIIPEARDLKKHMLASFFDQRFGELIISRTGYTGEDGFEILIDNEIMLSFWQELLAKNKNLVPCGLGARDILRLEMGYALYGHELSEDISPLESVSAWTVKLDKPNFFGKETLMKRPHTRVQQGVILKGQGILREGFLVGELGTLTSGGFSPTLNASIGIALLENKLPVGETVSINIRGREEPAEIVKIPFIGAS